MLIPSRKPLTKFTPKLFEMVLALASGVLMGMTFAPVEAWYLAWVALAPLWYLGCRHQGFTPILYALCWGIGCYGLGLSWLFGIHPMMWMGVSYLESLGIATFCVTFVTLWGASLAVLWMLSLQLINSKSYLNPLVRVVLGTACWCGLEELYSLTNLWWTSLAMSQSPHNLDILHLGQLAGPSTVTGAIVLFNGLIAEGYLAIECGRHLKIFQKIRYGLPYFGSAIASLIILHLIGSSLANRALIQIDPGLKIGVIQGSIGNEIRHYQSGYDLAMERYTNGYRSLVEQGVAAVVTPETALPYTESQIKRTPFYQAILAQKVPVFLGGFAQAGEKMTNSILTIGGDGRVIGRYDKSKLVPLGEYIPFEQYVGKFISTISPFELNLIAGNFDQIVHTPFGNFIFGICYDSAYPENFRRQAQTGELIITASNDAHYSSGMPPQHHALNLMRAIETDRWMVNASNTGYSTIIDPHGRTQWISKLDEFTVHADRVYRRSTQTLYVRYGNWLTPLLFAIGLILDRFSNKQQQPIQIRK
ncbi:apolipoprotein N-acyltransferase [Chamaesiphon sp. OTE_8_metabat_110]|uniref:apolipoprotein N-acyltransferase n=1 Tax=Chamaesiphon sp. OTE_8_metabat_110 TaxID=2964696 RepID=UPI00286C4BEA|nr:apolipoprotein N-acyltransferase [Chamaesiphon sp. OTE_8_metabat_110]